MSGYVSTVVEKNMALGFIVPVALPVWAMRLPFHSLPEIVCDQLFVLMRQPEKVTT
jgi:hypothetical protein